MAQFNMSESPYTGNLLLNQKRLIAITNGEHRTISVAEAATILNMPTQVVAKLMARWAAAGSLSRIKRGLYLTVPLKSSVDDNSPMDPWIIADNLFRPCYIGGLTAAMHWGLTDHSVQTNMVLTTQKPRTRYQSINGINFLLRSISQDAMFGLLPIWKGQGKIQISDPSRTMVDFFVDPSIGDGIRNVIKIFKQYLKSEHRNIELLFDYAKRLYNGAVFKRLGFLLEHVAAEEQNIIFFCKHSITTGYVKLDPKLDADKLISRWNLWVPAELKSILK